jgi:hypothetical protein
VSASGGTGRQSGGFIVPTATPDPKGAIPTQERKLSCPTGNPSPILITYNLFFIFHFSFLFPGVRRPPKTGSRVGVNESMPTRRCKGACVLRKTFAQPLHRRFYQPRLPESWHWIRARRPIVFGVFSLFLSLDAAKKGKKPRGNAPQSSSNPPLHPSKEGN